MMVDIRWVVLLVVGAAAVLLIRYREDWATPVLVGVAVVGLVFALMRL